MVTPADFAPHAWYRAEESGVVNGVFVAHDVSGNGRHATQATASRQPTRVYRPTGIYAYAWHFDGLDDYLQGHTDVVAAQNAQTVIALAKLTGSSTTRRVWGFGPLYSLFANGSQWAYYSNPSDAIVNLGGNTANWTVVAIRQHNDSVATKSLSTTLPVLGGALLRRSDLNGAPHYDSQIRGLVSVSHQRVYRDTDGQTWRLDVVMVGSTVGAQYHRTSATLEPRGTYSRVFDNIGGLPTTATVANTESAGARAALDENTGIGPWTPKNVMSAPPTLAIGAEEYLGGQAWPGLIAEVQVYNDYLELADIQSLYNDYFVPRYFTEPPQEPTSAPRLMVFGRDRLAAGDAAFLLAE